MDTEIMFAVKEHTLNLNVVNVHFILYIVLYDYYQYYYR